MTTPIKLPTKTGYNPQIEPLKNLKLPIELKNHRGDIIASIWFADYNKKYNWSVEGITNHSSGYHEFTECLETCFGKLYQEMQEYRKESEKHDRLVDALKESLSTPFNKL
jgi:cysteinyl-tRNA synthetase